MTAVPLRVANESFLTIAQARAGDCSCIGANSPSDDDIQTLINEVSDTIARLTGMRIAGRQEVVARPCLQYDTCCTVFCACCGLDAVPLGNNRPEIVEVTINGDVLNAAYWWLHWNGMQWVLARRPNETLGEVVPPLWPTTQDRWRTPDQDRTFAIRFTQGIHVDAHIIEAAALELLCDFAQDDNVRARALEGAIQVNAGNATIVRDRNLQASNLENPTDKIARGDLGPMMRRLMGLLAPRGASPSAVWSPDLMNGWTLNLEMYSVSAWITAPVVELTP